MKKSYLKYGHKVLGDTPNFKLVGRRDKLKALAAILMRKKANSVIVSGLGGVGISVLILGLQAWKGEEGAPFDVITKKFMWLDVDGLFSSGDHAVINREYTKIMDELYQTPDSVLIIEDTKDFIEACRNNGTTHFINALTSAVKKDKTQVILECREEDLGVVLKYHSDFRELFTLIDVLEPVGPELNEIVTDVTTSLSAFHGIEIANDVIATAIDLTTKFRTNDDRAQPDRSITLIDRAFSSYRLAAHSKNPSSMSTDEWTKLQTEMKFWFDKMRNAEREMFSAKDDLANQLEIESDRRTENTKPQEVQPQAEQGSALRRWNQAMSGSGFDSQEVQEIKARINTNQTIVTESKEKFEALTAKVNKGLILTADYVKKEYSRITGISAAKLDEDDRVMLANLETELKSKIFGQDSIIQKVADGVKVFKLGKRNKGNPLSFMFLGPSGVGKTELSKVLASHVYGDQNAMLRLDMSEYMEKHAVAKLIGAPPGYDGFDAGGVLTNFVRKKQNCIVLFDEIEKGHPDVLNICLQILSDGRLSDNVGREVPFRNVIVIFTTNIGQTEFLNQEISHEIAEQNAMVELGKTYRSEFLNRINGRHNILCFKRLYLDSIIKIVKREIKQIDEVYSDQGISTYIEERAVQDFCQDNYDPTIGARGLPGYIQSNLEPIIVNTLLSNDKFKGRLNVDYDNAKKTFVTSLVEAGDERQVA